MKVLTISRQIIYRNFAVVSSDADDDTNIINTQEFVVANENFKVKKTMLISEKNIKQLKKNSKSKRIISQKREIDKFVDIQNLTNTNKVEKRILEPKILMTVLIFQCQ